MAKAHGKNAYLEVDDIGGTSRNITSYCDEIDFNVFEVDTAEVSVFGSAPKSYIAGQQSGTLAVNGPFDPTVDLYVQNLVGSPEGDYIHGPAGNTTAIVKYTGKMICTSYNLSGDLGGAVRYSAAFQLTGTQTRTTF